jgi:hypothetical protein
VRWVESEFDVERSKKSAFTCRNKRPKVRNHRPVWNRFCRQRWNFTIQFSWILVLLIKVDDVDNRNYFQDLLLLLLEMLAESVHDESVTGLGLINGETSRFLPINFDRYEIKVSCSSSRKWIENITAETGEKSTIKESLKTFKEI